MAGSGHIAGVINPPAAGKYQYWAYDTKALPGTLPPTLEDWHANAVETAGSWWPDWDHWLAELSGPKIAARTPGKGKLKSLGDAPGTYVKVDAR
jgi:polyhydroxyalkanoate synthase